MKEFNQLLSIIKQLRSPINGCPWDLKQNEESLKEYILEEAYELVEAIESQSITKQKEELGDLLLQIILLSQINKEKDRFTIRDVINKISIKLIQRHPHVFADSDARSAEEVRANWQKLKIAEKKNYSILSDYPDKMPALLHAKRLSEQASAVGFDWKNADKAVEKIEEEIKELKLEISSGQSANIVEEIGDLLFAVTNVSRLLDVNPELALSQSNRKFKERFRYIEQKALSQGRNLNDLSLDEMEDLWQMAKKRKRQNQTP